MRIINTALLAAFARPGRCEMCGVYCRKREAHHLWSRGTGRLDISINLISLGSTRLMLCPCHRNVDAIGRAAFLEVVAKREEIAVDVIEATIHTLRRLPKPVNWEQGRSAPKRKKSASAWAKKAGELRRAAARAAYKRMKERKKAMKALEKKS